MKESVILVDKEDKILGPISKKDSHLRTTLDKPDAMPHRAFSAFLFNEKNELLLQRRSEEKITFPKMWTNTCCSHPLYNDAEMAEGPLRYHGVKTAAVRRLAYELDMRNIAETDFNMVTKILYKANTDKTWAEYEVDYILFAKKHSGEFTFDANPNEISHTEYVSKDNILDFLASEIDSGESQITPWFNLMLQTKLFSWWQHIEDQDALPAEDTKGTLINYMEGKDAIHLESLPSIVEYQRSLKGKRHFSSVVDRSKCEKSSGVDHELWNQSKSFRKDLKRQRALEREMKQKEEFYSQQVKDPNDPCASKFGTKDLLSSSSDDNHLEITKVQDLDFNKVGNDVVLRGRVHNIRAKGGSCFVILRETTSKMNTVQCALFTSTTSKGMINYVKRIPNESIIEIRGEVVRPEQDIKSCTQSVEIMVEEAWLLDKSDFRLPFQIEDDVSKTPSKPNEDRQVSVNQDTRLDNRVLDLRAPVNQSIMRMKSKVCNLFRQYLDQNEFIEIHTPKIVGGTTEGGSQVFKIDYYGQNACLAQSPQFYKQMAILSDFDRVYEIAPVFRAEDSNTSRHLSEFIALILK